MRTFIESEKKNWIISDDTLVQKLGISKRAVHNLEKDGKLILHTVGPNKTRVYKYESYQALVNPDVYGENSSRRRAMYIRVNSITPENKTLLHKKYEACAQYLNPMRIDPLNPVEDKKVFNTYSDYGSAVSIERKDLKRLIFDITSMRISEVVMTDIYQLFGDYSRELCKFLSNEYDVKFTFLNLSSETGEESMRHHIHDFIRLYFSRYVHVSSGEVEYRVNEIMRLLEVEDN